MTDKRAFLFLSFAQLSSPAQAYPIDCAILLCLAGGFPASIECTAAKAEFIRRITPFPIEPPLQIWNCPMGVRSPTFTGQRPIHDAVLLRSPQPTPFEPLLTKHIWGARANDFRVSGTFVRPTQFYYSDDISDPVYDIVRSIKVWHFDYRQEMYRDECTRFDHSRKGGYDLQGGYGWIPHELRAKLTTEHGASITDPDATPVISYSWSAPAEVSIHEADPAACDPFHYRSVFVSWKDQFGTRGIHEVRY